MKAQTAKWIDTTPNFHISKVYNMGTYLPSLGFSYLKLIMEVKAETHHKKDKISRSVPEQQQVGWRDGSVRKTSKKHGGKRTWRLVDPEHSQASHIKKENSWFGGRLCLIK